MTQKVIVNAKRKLFYCWSWDRWKDLLNLGGAGGCFAKGCRKMYVPGSTHFRLPEVLRAAACRAIVPVGVVREMAPDEGWIALMAMMAVGLSFLYALYGLFWLGGLGAGAAAAEIFEDLGINTSTLAAAAYGEGQEGLMIIIGIICLVAGFGLGALAWELAYKWLW